MNAECETRGEDDSGCRIKEPKGVSPPSRLDPFLDRENVVRIAERIKEVSVSQDTKHPIVLRGQGHISSL